MNDYEDMLYMQRPESSHPHMSRLNRAAQFSPFAALTGFGDKIEETGRLTDSRISLSQEKIDEINSQLAYIADHIADKPQVQITYFIEDPYKEGGQYVSLTCMIKSISSEQGIITTTDGEQIAMSDIAEIIPD